MKLQDVVAFRKDILFNGAVQINWFETDRKLADKAAEHYVFHGPGYHGVAEADLDGNSHRLLDTANFTLDVLQRVTGEIADEPFALAIAGYGTGKSHLGVTMASLLSAPSSDLSIRILANLHMADPTIANNISARLHNLNQPFLVVAINGMQDFDLSGEIMRQILGTLHGEDLDTNVLENLRPRFKSAIHFTEAFFSPLVSDFQTYFGDGCKSSDIVSRLGCQDEEAFQFVSSIYEQKMGSPIHAVGQESLQDFIRVANETYCGPGKHYAGILVLFDEFGRYLEFAVQKPHVAGSGALQQLFESVQANAGGVFLLCFIQYDLKAYISRVAPELREDLNRYVTRYDGVRKVRLSTNLETLIANLLEKKKPEAIDHHIEASLDSSDTLLASIKRWFPDVKNQALWMDTVRFDKVIRKGCWPLHPLSTWVLYKLSSVGKSLQQRSALSFLADAYSNLQDLELTAGWSIYPIGMCDDAMISEFLASEQYGQQGATAHAYESAMHKYQHELGLEDIAVLKAVMLSSKIGTKIASKDDCQNALAMFSGLSTDSVLRAICVLERDYAILEWDDRLNQYEIAGDAVPKRTFLGYLASKVQAIGGDERAQIFSQSFKKWTQKESYETDFGSMNNISTKEWNYSTCFTSVSMLQGHVDFALRNWREAVGVDENKGQLLYCYVGPESNVSAIEDKITSATRRGMQQQGITSDTGVPLAVLLLNDKTGAFGDKIAEYWVLQEQMVGEEFEKFNNYILDRRNSLLLELQNQFEELERDRRVVFAVDKPIGDSRLKNMLTQLFDLVYPKRLPFPFDGFHTAKGNAAKDCQVFTKELFLGNLDRDWISARSVQQKNRAFQVLDESWSAIDGDGSIRIKPATKSIRDAIDTLDELVGLSEDAEGKEPVNVGDLARALCAPPYGGNIASVGLLLSVFVSRRKRDLDFLKDKLPISIENWLQEAFPGNFLDWAILDVTDIIRVSQQSLSQWEILFNDWSIERSLTGKVDYQSQASDLKSRLVVPQSLYYKYQHLSAEADSALLKIEERDVKLNTALLRIERARGSGDAGASSWGAADLESIRQAMITDGEAWSTEQTKEIEDFLAASRVQTQQCFETWLRNQTASSEANLGKFEFDMVKRVGHNLEVLGLTQEQKMLERHVLAIAANIRAIAEIRRLMSNIQNMVASNKATDSTPIAVLNTWLHQAEELSKLLITAAGELQTDDREQATKMLARFTRECREQIAHHHDRASKIYDVQASTLAEISNFQQEVAVLLQVFAGMDSDVQDFRLVQRQLEMAERHYRRLDNDTMNHDELDKTYRECLAESETELDGEPPLDNEMIYDGIMKTISSRRERVAYEWMEDNVPDLLTIAESNPDTVHLARMRLKTMPRVLSDEQITIAKVASDACEERLDALEIEGLLVRFLALSQDNQKQFLDRIKESQKT